MSDPALDHHVRTIAEVRPILEQRARSHRNPFMDNDPDVAMAVLDHLTSLDPADWAAGFSAAAEPHVATATAAEATGDTEGARRHWLLAHDWFLIARYPAPTSPAKRQAYARCRDAFLHAAPLLDPPAERVEMPFAGRADEGTEVVAYVRRPAGPGPHPVAVHWGGIDTYKEEACIRSDGYLAAGLAVVAIDMPGVGEAPLAGSEDAERLWDAVLDWIAAADDLDTDRVALVGLSTGGYWATKVAHTHADRVAAAVNHGGPAHHAFAADWIAEAQRGEYPFELAETLASAFGHSGFDAWVEYAPRLSLLDQGVLDRPCAPLLCVNGLDDSVFPIADHYLLLEHGSPKAARFYPGGHMGWNPQTGPTIIAWLTDTLGIG